HIISVTHKPVAYSAHAEIRLKQRRITRREVRAVLATGVVSELPNGGTRKDAVVDGRRIAVLYREYRGRLHIWTVMLVPN
ncbi:MAG TPA: DUF4258 domain-containing protein, partial [Gemmatimonadaceae bacterium]